MRAVISHDCQFFRLSGLLLECLNEWWDLFLNVEATKNILSILPGTILYTVDRGLLNNPYNENTFSSCTQVSLYAYIPASGGNKSRLRQEQMLDGLINCVVCVHVNSKL